MKHTAKIEKPMRVACVAFAKFTHGATGQCGTGGEKYTLKWVATRIPLGDVAAAIYSDRCCIAAMAP